VSIEALKAAPSARAFLRLFDYNGAVCTKVYYYYDGGSSVRQSVTKDEDYALFVSRLKRLELYSPWKAHLNVWCEEGSSLPESPAGEFATLVGSLLCHPV
jgi:hypothetical protein